MTKQDQTSSGTTPTGILDAGAADTWESGRPTFTRRNRLYRLAWELSWTLLGRWTPPPLRGWRRTLLRLFGARVASSAIIYPSARIWSPANLSIGEYAAIGPRAIVYNMAPIYIGDYAIISQGAHLCAGTHDVEDTHFQLRASPISIGKRAWVAAEAFVGPGVTVGDGAVLGARGCAMKDLESWAIYSGNPAQPLRARRLRID